VSGRVRGAATAAIVALLGGCQADDPTGIVVEVTSDLAAPPERMFHLRVLDPEGRPQHDVPFGAGDLPARLHLVTEDADRAAAVTVEASVVVGGRALTRTATLRFRRGAVVLVRLPLNAECLCVTCDPGLTCEEGRRCQSIFKDPAALPRYAPPGQPGPAGTISAPVCTGDGGTPAPGPDASGDLSPARSDAASDTAAPPQLDAGTDGGPVDAAPADLAATVDAPLPAIDSGLDLPAAADLIMLTADLAVPPPDAAIDLSADLAVSPDAPPPLDAGGRPQGAACTTSAECLSAACVDGFCCASACTTPCMACSNLRTGAANGQCAPALAGTDPDGDCAADAPSTCLYDGMCNGAGACRLYQNTTLCAAATCAGATFTPMRMCTGAGACPPPAPQNCGMFLCTGTGCPTACQSHAQCISTAYCDGSACLPKKPALAGCMAGYECLSGSCPALACL
jgi:hypothetical protein